MEFVISLFLGTWIFIGGWLAYKNLKKDYFNKGESNK